MRSDTVKRYPSKAGMLRFLQGVGIPVGTIIDVGVQEETFELRQAFPKLRHILFEPVSEFYGALRDNYREMDYVLVPAALSDRDGTAYLHKFAVDGGRISHSRLVNLTADKPCEIVTTMRLDSFLKGRPDPKPYLLKVDVDGHEMQIMKGIGHGWGDISCVIVEAPLATFAERMNYLLAKGFRLFDIVDQCYYYGMLSQVDLVFVAEKFWKLPSLRPWETMKFSWEEYACVADFEKILQNAAVARPRRFGLSRFKCWKKRTDV